MAAIPMPIVMGMVAGIVCGVLAMGFGLFAPLVVRGMLAAPPAFLATLGGLAMLRVLQASFVAAFNVGAPFWGLVAGMATAWLLERDELAGGRRDAPVPTR